MLVELWVQLWIYGVVINREYGARMVEILGK
jgi:hypothetical protein